MGYRFGAKIYDANSLPDAVVLAFSRGTAVFGFAQSSKALLVLLVHVCDFVVIDARVLALTLGTRASPM